MTAVAARLCCDERAAARSENRLRCTAPPCSPATAASGTDSGAGRSCAAYTL